MTPKSGNWKDYEHVARQVLSDLRQKLGILEVEGNQALVGTSGAVWNVEGKAFMANGSSFLVIECRRYTTKRLNQEAVGGFAYRIHDVGGTGGLLVSPLPLQKGAKFVAKASNVLHVRLEPWSTSDDYLVEILGRSLHGCGLQSVAVFGDKAEAEIIRSGRKV